MTRNQYGVGIDFGTTNSVGAIYYPDLKKTEPLTHQKTNLPHPSVIWYRADGTIIVGPEAKKNVMGLSNVEGNTFVYSAKRKLGKDNSIALFGKKIRMHEIAAEIFRYLREDAEIRDSNYKLSEAVVTVPVYFDGYARRELRKAADIAGIYIKIFVHEPFAAIVGYCHREGAGLQLENMEGRIILVYDWGGGTLDITLAQIADGGAVELATAGIEDRAGDHFDNKLMRFSKSALLERIKISQERFQIFPSDFDRLRTECERAKISLSTENKERIQVANISKFDGKYVDMNEYVSREDLNELIENDVNDSINEIKKALDAANVAAKEVDHVLLIGGSSRIPLVRKHLREMFGHRIVEIHNASTIIAEGAAIVDAEGLQPVLARSLNVELSDGILYEVFSPGIIADPNVCYKKLNFFCTDNRDGEAKLVIKDLAGRIDATRPLMKKVLSIPVSDVLPKPYQHERVTVDFALDKDMILHVSGKGATKEKGASCEIHDLCFGLRLEGVSDAIKS